MLVCVVGGSVGAFGLLICPQLKHFNNNTKNVFICSASVCKCEIVCYCRKTRTMWTCRVLEREKDVWPGSPLNGSHTLFLPLASLASSFHQQCALLSHLSVSVCLRLLWPLSAWWSHALKNCISHRLCQARLLPCGFSSNNTGSLVRQDSVTLTANMKKHRTFLLGV